MSITIHLVLQFSSYMSIRFLEPKDYFLYSLKSRIVSALVRIISIRNEVCLYRLDHMSKYNILAGNQLATINSFTEVNTISGCIKGEVPKTINNRWTPF